MVNKLTFSRLHFQESGTIWQIVPQVDLCLLTDLASKYEVDHKCEPAGGYAGLVSSSYQFGPLDQYFFGRVQDGGLSEANKIAVLGCSCGEVGCWPLLAAIQLDADCIIWQDFEQPHRLQRDYSAFGPFRFRAEEYRVVIKDLIVRLGATVQTQAK